MKCFLVYYCDLFGRDKKNIKVFIDRSLAESFKAEMNKDVEYFGDVGEDSMGYFIEELDVSFATKKLSEAFERLSEIQLRERMDG